MKLLLALLAGLGLATVAIAAPSSQDVGTGTSVKTVVVNPHEGALSVDGDTTPIVAPNPHRYYGYTFVYTEYCSGTTPKTLGQWIDPHDGSTYVNLSDPSASYLIQTPYGLVTVKSDSVNSNVQFTWNWCAWRQNYRAHDDCGICLGVWAPNVDKKPDCNSGTYRQRSMRSNCVFDHLPFPKEHEMPSKVAVPTDPPKIASRQDFSEVAAPEDFPQIASALAAAGDRYFGYSFKATEYCEGKNLKMKLQWKNSIDHATTQFMDITNPGTIYFVQTPHGKVQVRWNAASSAIKFHYKTCDWSVDRFNTKDCGYCDGLGWKPPVTQPDCFSMKRTARTFSAACAFYIGGSVTKRDAVPRADLAIKDLPFTLPPIQSFNDTHKLPVNLTSAHGLRNLTVVIERPKIILKTVPSNTDGQPPTELVILPFHVKITDSCVDSRRAINAVWTNGGRTISDLALDNDSTWSLDHKIPGYTNLTLGAYDEASNRLRFHYNACDWYDDETWKTCGECRAALWTAPAPDCSTNGGSMASRTKDMDCSFILGVRDKSPAAMGATATIDAV